MPKTKRIRLSRARALLARLSHHRRRSPPSQKHHERQPTPPSTPPTPQKQPLQSQSCQRLHHHRLLRVPKPRSSRTRSDMHFDNQAMQTRLAELEMIEMENSSLRLQLDDLQRALDGVTEEKNNAYVGELEMADIENSSLRLQLECLRSEFRKPCYGPIDAADKRLAWLNVDPV